MFTNSKSNKSGISVTFLGLELNPHSPGSKGDEIKVSGFVLREQIILNNQNNFFIVVYFKVHFTFFFLDVRRMNVQMIGFLQYSNLRFKWVFEVHSKPKLTLILNRGSTLFIKISSFFWYLEIYKKKIFLPKRSTLKCHKTVN